MQIRLAWVSVGNGPGARASAGGFEHLTSRVQG